MKILILSSLAADTGSAVRARAIFESLKKAGAEVDYVGPFCRSLPFKLDLLICLPWYVLRIVFSPSNIVFVVKSYPNVGIPLFFKKLLGGKIIIDTDDLAFAYSQGGWSRLSRLSQELFLPLADLHTYHHPKLLGYLESQGVARQKTYQLKQGVDLDIFQLKKVKPQNKLLVFVGHFDVACDVDKILKTMVSISKAISQVKLVLIGDGPRKKEFQALAKKLKIENNLIWTGLISQKQVVNWLCQAEACLIYYQNKKANQFRSSLKLREYLALGKKVVCNDVGELKDFAPYTYQTDSRFQDFAKMVVKVLMDLDDKRQIKGRDFVRKNYSWQKISQDFFQKIRSDFEK